jgi:hypothetical protein
MSKADGWQLWTDVALGLASGAGLCAIMVVGLLLPLWLSRRVQASAGECRRYAGEVQVRRT